MRKGRRIPPLTVTQDERETLERWARRPKTAQALAQRARIAGFVNERRPHRRVGGPVAPTCPHGTPPHEVQHGDHSHWCTPAEPAA